MVKNTENQTIEYVENLRQFLSIESKEELYEILAYGEKMKVEGERKKKEFWMSHNRADFLKLLGYKWRNKKEIEGQYKYLDMIKGLEREKFIEEYLHDDMLYCGKCEESEKNGENDWIYYEDWIKPDFNLEQDMKLGLVSRNEHSEETLQFLSKIELKEGVKLDCEGGWYELVDAVMKKKLKRGVELLLTHNVLGVKGAEIISKMKLEEGVLLKLNNTGIGVEGVKIIAQNMELKEGVLLGLSMNKLGDEGAKAVAENLRLKEGVVLNLCYNEIGAKGAKAIAQMELREGVFVNLGENEIGDEGARAIMNNMELKNGEILKLVNNSISEGVKQELRNWENSCRDMGINCKIML